MGSWFWVVHDYQFTSKEHNYFQPMLKFSHKTRIEFQILFMFRVYFCPLLTTPAPTVF